MEENQNSKLVKNMTDLNKVFLINCVKLLKENPDLCLIPLMNDYMLYTQKIVTNQSEPFKEVGCKNGNQQVYEDAFAFFNDFLSHKNGNGQQQQPQKTQSQTQPQQNQAIKRKMTSEDAQEDIIPNKSMGVENNKPKVSDCFNSFTSTASVKPTSTIPSNPTNPLSLFSFNTPNTFGNPTSSSTNTTAATATIKPFSDVNLSTFLSTEPKGLLGANPFPSSPSSSSSSFNPLPGPGSFSLPTATSSTPAIVTLDNKVNKPTISFAFTPSSVTASNKNENNDEEGEYVPPKNEFKAITEDDHIYTVKCKLFRFVDGSYKDGGVGNLFIKKLENDYYQILVRAENSLGTILLNMGLNKGFLFSLEKNNVKTTDPSFGPNSIPVPLLIRVKDAAGAEQLLNKLRECQDSSQDS